MARTPGSPTLAQATGGRPGRVAPRPAAPKSLGLGLGLGAKQRMGFQQAAQGGQSGQWLAAHPGVQQRIGQINPNSAMGGQQQQRIQSFMGTGQSQRMPRPPQNVPAGAQPQQPQPQAPLQMPQQPPMGGYTGDGAAQQTSLGQQSGGNYGDAMQQAARYGGGGQGGLGQMLGGFQRDPNQQTFTPQQQQGQYGGYQGFGQRSMGPQQYGGMAYGGPQGGLGGLGSYLSGYGGVQSAQPMGYPPQQQARPQPADPYGYGRGGGGYGGSQFGAGMGGAWQQGGGLQRAQPQPNLQTNNPNYGGGGYM